MQTLTVLPIEHVDVYGKTKFYLKISNDVDSYVITVGQRTIDECKRMQKMEPQSKLEFDTALSLTQTVEKGLKEGKDGNKG